MPADMQIFASVNRNNHSEKVMKVHAYKYYKTMKSFHNSKISQPSIVCIVISESCDFGGAVYQSYRTN